MSNYLTSTTLISWVCSSVSGAVVLLQRTVSQLLFGLAIAFALITVTGLLGSLPIAEAASCGAKNQRPCTIFERIPSCNSGLYEDFKKGLCLSKAVPGRDCGRKNQRACKVWERIPSCNAGLVEDLKRGWCVAKAVPGKDCGNANQRPCTIVERIPSCNKGLVEHLPTNRCTSLADLGNKFQCGKRNQKPCKVLERIPSCDDNLKEDFAKGICVAVPCGKKYGRPCTIVERIPSCDVGLVEDFLKGKCVPSEDAERHRIAGEKLQQIGEFVLSKVNFATNVANNPQVRNNLNGPDKTAVARVVNRSGVGETQMPDGYLLRTLSVGATVGGKFLFVGTGGGAGAAIDLKGQRPAYAYATGNYSFGPGLAAGGGIDVGFWVCQNNKIGGDSWGVEFGVDDIALAIAKKVNLKGVGPSLGIGLWFDYSQPPVFQGFTITPGFGIGADFGGVVKAGTAVEDDPSIECDGRPKTVSSLRPKTGFPPVNVSPTQVGPAAGAGQWARLSDLSELQTGVVIGLRGDTGNYLARCAGCVPGAPGHVRDAAFIHVSSLGIPFSQFTITQLPNGKYGLRADTGNYLARCAGCVPGVRYPDSATIHIPNAAGSFAQWTILALPNGKYGLRADTGNYLARCAGCVPGGRYSDSAFIHVPNSDGSYAQWEIFVRK